MNSGARMLKSSYKRSLDAASILLCCLAGFQLCVKAYADDRDRTILQFQHAAWTAKVGAPGGVEALAQTRDGYLWMGTNNGLYRFDGVSFERFDPIGGPAFPTRVILSLLALPSGDLWIGFRAGGVSLLRAGVNTNYGASEGLPQGRVIGLAQDGEGAIWAGTAGGLARFEQGRWKRVEEDWNYPGKAAQGVYLDRQGTLWVATESTIVFLPAKARRFQTTGTHVGIVRQFAESSDGQLWMAETTRSVHPVPDHRPGSSGPEIRVGSDAILFDAEGSLWITSLGDGLRRVPFPERLRDQKIGEFSHAAEIFTANDGLSSDNARTILEDREGNIWVGTANGLDRFRKSALTPLMLSGKFYQYQLVAGDQGDVLISSLGPGFARVHDGKLKSEHMPMGVCTGYRDRTGTWWVGLLEPSTSDMFTEHQRIQVLTFRSEGGRLSRAAAPLVLAKAYATPRVLAEDRSGIPLFGTQEGFFALKEGRWTRYEMPPELARLSVLTAFTDSSGGAWFGYNEGTIALLDGATVRTFSADQGLHVGSVRAIDGLDGRIWAGGEHGLAFLDGSKFRAVTPADREEFSGVSGIAETSDGSLWLGEYRGVVHIPAAEVGMVLRNPSYRIRYDVLESLDGLPGAIQETPQYPSVIQGTDGRLWFATASAVAWIDPVHIPRNLVPPPVSIRWVNVNGKRYAPFAALKLPALTRSLEIDYTALSLAIPERVHFRYRLAGIDDDWQVAGTRREAFYTGLRPGKYEFRVIACNNDGVWNEQGAMLDFTIAPAWYQTNWFLTLCLVASILAIYALYSLRLRQVAGALSARFDERLAERTRMARELHDTFLQTIQGSKLVTDDALEKSSDPAHMRRALEQLSVWLDQAVHEGRAALNSLRTSTTQRNDLAEAFKRAIDECRIQRPIEVSFSVSGDSKEMHPVVRDEIYRMGYEAIRNACMHSQGSRLEVELKYGHDLVVLVRDNGIGIDPAVAKEGKDRHFGLQGMRERAARISSKLTVANSADSGTLVTVVVPGGIAFRKPSPSPLEKIRTILRRAGQTPHSD